MRVLVTGANGFIGSHLISHLLAKGHAVRAAVRRGRGSDPALAGAEIVEIDGLGPQTDWSAALSGMEAVIHLAARVHILKETAADPRAEFNRVNVAGTRRLAEEAARRGVRRFIFLSSIGAVANTSAQTLTEESPCRPDTPYGQSKLEAERALTAVCADSSMDSVILRPVIIYGPGNPGNFLRLLQITQKAFPLPIARVNNRRSFLYVENLTDALGRCLTDPRAAGQTFLIADADPLSTPELIRRLAAILGRPVRLWPFPPAVIALAGRLLGKSADVERLLGSLTVSTAKLERNLGWRPPVALNDGLARTGNWFKSAPRH